MIEFLIRIFEEYRDDEAIIWRDQVFTYGWLLKQIATWYHTIREHNIPSGSVVALEADFSPNGIALFLALIEHRCMLVSLTSSVEAKKPEFMEIAEVEVSFQLNAQDNMKIIYQHCTAVHPYYQTLRQLGVAGLVLFSSGSTGKSKAAVHNLTALLEKFKVRRRQQRAITFLLYDHIGGVNTMLYTLSNGGCIITVPERSPDGVLYAVEKYAAELLPTSPTFLNLILLSEAYKRHNLGSLKTVTYGTEPMPANTLKRFHELFPGIVLQQTYGLSEVGILRSKSKSSDSLWVKVGGEGFETRVVDGILQIKANSAMLGYLNAPSPFTEDHWFDTGDAVEVDGEYIKILGRKSEIINVGGEKVYPAEVESVIQEVQNVAEATVYGEKNPITGNIVCAQVRLTKNEPAKEFIVRLKQYCRKRLQNYKTPVKVVIANEQQYSDRFKKRRSVEQ
jgi:long-chain acyl-CoA synthetase